MSSQDVSVVNMRGSTSLGLIRKPQNAKLAAIISGSFFNIVFGGGIEPTGRNMRKHDKPEAAWGTMQCRVDHASRR